MQINETEFKEIYEKYVDMIYRICFMYLKNVAETEDATQNVFLKFIKASKSFQNEEHIKASLIVTAQNECKNVLKHWWKRKRIPLENVDEGSYLDNFEKDKVLNEVLKLPDKYKLPLYMYYYEGYSTKEIAQILKVNYSTIRTRMVSARNILRLVLEVKDYEQGTIK